MANLITNINQACADLANIKKAIIDNGVEVANGTPSGEYARKVDNVYEAGKDTMLHDMWEALQKGGKRTDYNNAFRETSITDEMFKPIYDMQPTTAYHMFFGNDGITDLKNIPVKLDFSKCVEIQRAFYGMLNLDTGIGLKRVGVLDCRNIETWRGSFAGLFDWDIYLEEVEKMILPDDDDVSFNTCFNACYALKEIRFEGAILQDISFADCPLSRESIESIVNALSPSASGKTAIFNYDAVWSAIPLDIFDELIADKTNWTIELV